MTSPTSPIPEARRRLMSLDALRGFDMFWILGADLLGHAINSMEQSQVSEFVAGQLDHSAWAGLTCYDVIFPLFIFIVGVSVVFSLRRVLAEKNRHAALKRIFVRAFILFLLGIFYNGGLSREWPTVRLAGVLQRIAIVYALVALLFIYMRPRNLAIVGSGLLVGYWALLTFVPIRNITLTTPALETRLGISADLREVGWSENPQPSDAFLERAHEAFDSTTESIWGRYDPGLNLANHLDFAWLPGASYDAYWDPEGYLSTLPAIATGILGVFAGLILERRDWDDRRKAQVLLIAGIVALVLGFLWGLQFPIVKKIWTSSFVLVVGGWSFLLLALFYYVVDIRGWKGWCRPFVWIGMNPITLYLATGVVGFHEIARRLVGGSVQRFLDETVKPGAGELGVTLVALLAIILFARFLYKRKIFLKV